MKTWIACGILTAAVSVGFGAEAAKEAAPAEKHIDLAICLDTSNSMDGLIDSAKQKLWAVVNELATAKPRPRLRVALYQYGNDSLSKENGWVQRVCDLTGDLDEIYEKLFALRTNGGTEFVARVTRAAADELKWDTGKNTLRILFVAGNEAATQDGKFKLKDVCAATAGKGIIINTIFCGNEARGRQTGWADVALWADGQYAAIDQNEGTVVISTPYDKKLSELGAKLNETYVAYGPGGGKGSSKQKAQDSNALSLSPAASAERATAKAGGLYRNAAWDLVDAMKDKKVDLAKVPEAELPENMRKMTPEERKKYVADQAAERGNIQKEIKDLDAKRQAHVKVEMGKRGLEEGASFDAALRKAVRMQAESKDFKFETKPAK